MRWAGHVAHIERDRKCLKGTDFSEDLDIDGRIILEWIIGKFGGKVWTGCIWLQTVTSTGFLRTW
jgi:hypothetical protein